MRRLDRVDRMLARANELAAPSEAEQEIADHLGVTIEDWRRYGDVVRDNGRVRDVAALKAAGIDPEGGFEAFDNATREQRDSWYRERFGDRGSAMKLVIEPDPADAAAFEKVRGAQRRLDVHGTFRLRALLRQLGEKRR